MRAPSKSNPPAIVNAEKQSTPNLAYFQGKILPVILHHGFFYRYLAQHITPPAQLFPMWAQYVWPPFSNAQPRRGVLGV